MNMKWTALIVANNNKDMKSLESIKSHAKKCYTRGGREVGNRQKILSWVDYIGKRTWGESEWWKVEKAEEEREKGEVVYIVYSFMLIKLSLLHSIVINKIYEIL